MLPGIFSPFDLLLYWMVPSICFSQSCLSFTKLSHSGTLARISIKVKDFAEQLTAVWGTVPASG